MLRPVTMRKFLDRTGTGKDNTRMAGTSNDQVATSSAPGQPRRWDGSLLAPAGEARPGYERGILSALPCMSGFFTKPDDDRYELCLWNIWHKGDNPAKNDPIKQQLNVLQAACKPLTDDDRYIRIQIAVLLRCWWEFPKTVDRIIEGIATGHVNLDGRISCEPPWSEMLEVLRYQRHHPGAAATRAAGRTQVMEEEYALPGERQRRAMAYMNTLTWWMYGGELASFAQQHPQWVQLASTIYRQLGEPTNLKRLYVGKLCAAIAWVAVVFTRYDRAPSHQVMAVFDQAITQQLAGEADPIGRMIHTQDICHHAYFRHLDRQIAAIGAGHPVDRPDKGCEQQRIHEAVTAYVHALGSWLMGRSCEQAEQMWVPAAITVQRVFSVLGHPSPRKRWLAACLWHHLQENQRHHGRGALDDQPETFAIPPDALAV
jgi:hypothetical protein